MDQQLNGLLEEALDDLLDTSDKTRETKKSEQEEEEVTGVKKDKKGEEKRDSDEAGTSNADVGIDEEEMNKFFENMTAQLKAELPNIDPEEAKIKINESVPQIFDLMQNLLSKELLYPALKDLSPKFEEWLKKEGKSLTKTDKRRYKKQKAIIDEIIEVFDDESLSNQERFEKNLDLMETMQSLGSPPEELTVPHEIGKCSVM